MPRPILAIIGAGFSGATLAMQIAAASGAAAPRIFLIDRSGRFGPGLAYSALYPGHLMNVRAAKLNATPASDDFADWLNTQDPEAPSELRFAPRMAYGAYLEAHLRRVARACEPQTLNFVREAAIACRVRGPQVEITLQSGAVLAADAAVLALGNQPAALPAPFSDAPDVAGHVIDPWTPEIARIGADDDVLLLGTGLTMVDAVLRLTATPRTGALFALSRRGLLPSSHAHAPSESDTPLWHEGELSEILKQVRADIDEALRHGDDWQKAFDRLRPTAVALWMSWPLEKQLRFLRHLRPYWDTHRHRMPPQVHRWIGALMASGALRSAAGRVLDVRRAKDHFTVTYQPRGGGESIRIAVDHIVNCTGPNADLSRSSDPLLRQLLANGVARTHATGLGLDVEYTGRVIDSAGKAQPRLFALGPVTQGAFWETTAVPEIRANAAALARTLLATLGAKRVAAVHEAPRLALPARAAARRLTASPLS